MNLNSNFYKSNLTFKLVFLFIITTIVPILISGYITFEISKSTIEAETIDKLETIANLKTQRIVENFESIKADMLAVTSYPDIKKHFPILKSHFGDWDNPEYLASKKILNDQLIEFEKAKSMVIDIMLINEDGKIVYNTNPDHGSKELGLLLPDPDQKAFSEGKKGTYIAQMFKNYLEEFEPYILLSAPVYDEDNFLGIMTFELDMDLVFSIVGDSTGLGETGQSIIATHTDEGAIFLSPAKHNPNATLNDIIPFGSPFGIAMQDAVSGKHFSGISFDYNGNEIVVVGQYIPLLDWGVVSQIDSSEAFSPVAHLENLNIVLAIIFTIMVGILGFAASIQITRPIMKLNESSTAVAHGDFSKAIKHKGDDELASFIQSFNLMLNQLKNADLQQKKSKIKLEKLYEELKKTDHLKMDFSSMIAHELKTPLTPILGWCEALKIEEIAGKLNKEQKEAIDTIETNANRLHNVIGDLLDAQKLELDRLTISKETISVNEMLDLVVKDYKNVLTSGKQIKNLFTGEIKLFSDRKRLDQVFDNLIRNAIDFIPEKTGIIEINAIKNGNNVEFSVHDNGKGILKEDQKKLFKKFYQVDTSAKREHGGTGLGLSIVKGIVEVLDGKLRVESEVGKGSSFYFTIPMNGEDTK